MDANHAERLAPEIGDGGQVADASVLREEGTDERIHLLRRENRVEGMDGPERVPQRETRVVFAVRAVDLGGGVAVAPVDVREEVRLLEAMVERGVDELERIADKNMYEDKELFYKERGIDRRL